MTFPISQEGRGLLGLGAFFVFFATCMVCARICSRHIKKAGYGLDDIFSLAALPCFYAQGLTLRCLGRSIALTFLVALHAYAVIAGGLGFHQWQNSTSTNQNIIKSMTIIQYPYSLSLLFVRLSICLLLRRIFIQRWLRICSTYTDRRRPNVLRALLLLNFLTPSVLSHFPKHFSGHSCHASCYYGLQTTGIQLGSFDSERHLQRECEEQRLCCDRYIQHRI